MHAGGKNLVANVFIEIQWNKIRTLLNLQKMSGLVYDNVLFDLIKNIIISQTNKAGFTRAEAGVMDDLTNIVCSCKTLFC